MHRHKLQRVAENSPKRCQGTTHFGQCTFEQMPGEDYCLMHKGQGRGNYRLPDFLKSRVKEKAASARLLDLSEEIAMLRVLIEEKFSLVKTPNDLILMSAELADLLTRVEKLTMSLSRIQENAKTHLDRNRVIAYTEELVMVISEFVDADKLTDIVERIQGIPL